MTFAFTPETDQNVSPRLILLSLNLDNVFIIAPYH